LIKDDDLVDILMSMEVEEKGIAGIFWDRGIHVARRPWRAGVLQLEDPAQVGVDPEPEEVTVVANLIVVEAEARLIHQKWSQDGNDGCLLELFDHLRSRLKAQRNIMLKGG
jgi:translation initiation factor 6 (eIF-6)